MNRKIERFFDEYDEIGHRLSMAHERDFARVLRTWFACLDEAPDIISSEIRRLEALQSWDTVESEVVKTSRRLDSPRDRAGRWRTGVEMPPALHRSAEAPMRR